MLQFIQLLIQVYSRYASGPRTIQVQVVHAHRATFQCVINAMNTSWLFYKLVPPSNVRNKTDLHQFA